MSVIKSLAIGLIIVLSAVIAFAQESETLSDNVVELRSMANEAYAKGEQEAYRSIVARLQELRPNNSEYMYRLVLAHAALGELTEAFNMMLFMQRQGLSYDFNQSPDSTNLRDTKLYPYLNDLMIKAGDSMGEVTKVASLDTEIGHTEAIDWDPGRDAFLVGSVTNGRVLAVREDGSFQELLRADDENGIWGIHDLIVDEGRNRLWLTSSATSAFAGFDPVDRGRAALVELELDSLKLVKRYPVPVDGLPHSLGSMAMAGNGDIYAADRSLPIIYRLKAGEDRISPVFGTRQLVTLRGIAVSEDGQKVYVADHEMGIVRLDMGTGKVDSLSRQETLNLGGVDGLEYVDGDLVIIQNGIQPQRIMRLVLDEDGISVADVAPVAVALEEFDYPNFGTVVDEDLVFFANSQQRGEPGPVQIVRTSLAGLQNIVPPDMQRYMEEQARRRMAPPEPRAEPPAADDAGDDEGSP